MSTPAEELRAAVTRLRCDHMFTVRQPDQPPSELLCLACGIPFMRREVVSAELAERLAALLEAARQLTRMHKTDPAYEAKNGLRWCEECNDEECEALRNVDKALAVARVINGTAS